MEWRNAISISLFLLLYPKSLENNSDPTSSSAAADAVCSFK